MSEKKRFEVLDGWRGISILAVLACHLLPLGPKRWDLNYSMGLFGMALFFGLSGFLITGFLLRRGGVRDFLIRRLCRILPLAWVALLIGLWMSHAPADDWLPNFLFYANLPPFHLAAVTGHFWSLCVEVQFYATVALVFSLFGRRGLVIGLPIAAIAVTGLRVYLHAYSAIATYARVDEILAGGVLALIYAGELGARARSFVAGLNPLLMLGLLCASTLTVCGPIDYARPYFAAALLGCTLLQSEEGSEGLLKSPILAYIAEISYALYIVHPFLIHSWLGSGSKLVKYAKRPLLLAATFAIAHVSTFYYESRWIAFGKKLSTRPVSAARPTGRLVTWSQSDQTINQTQSQNT